MENTQSKKIEETRKKLLTSDEFVFSELKKLQLLNELKSEIRYGQEREVGDYGDSVAEHIFGMHIAFQYFLPLENPSFDWDKSKMLEMITLHDIDEVITGDTIGYDKTDAHRKAEVLAMKEILQKMPQHMTDNSKALLDEYHERTTIEAKFVKAIDKIETLIYLFEPKGKELLHRMKTTFDQNASIKVQFFEEFPVIMHFYEVCSKRMCEEGYFVEPT